MNLYPALDLRGGKVVRLRQGDPAQQTVYGDDPLDVARRWIALGARWLHVINLDGTFSVANDNEAVVSALVRLGVPIQFGGGLRSVDDVRRSLEVGVARVILGTLAVEQPDTVRTLLEQVGAERLVVALDSKDGQVTTHGWQHGSGQSAMVLGRQFAAMGVRYALYTDISRDGELSGVNVAATVALARDTGLQMIASGGVASLDDVRALHNSQAVEGAILGTALYRGLIDLRDALRLVSGEEA